MSAATHSLLLKALWRASLISPGKFLSTFLLSHFQGVKVTLALHDIYESQMSHNGYKYLTCELLINVYLSTGEVLYVARMPTATFLGVMWSF